MHFDIYILVYPTSYPVLITYKYSNTDRNILFIICEKNVYSEYANQGVDTYIKMQIQTGYERNHDSA